MINITLPDGSVHKFERGISALEIASQISDGLKRNVLSAKVNGDVYDATIPILKDSKVQLLTWSNPEGKATFWHSSAHLLAEALEALYPGVKFGIGPPIENGFYYDIDLGDRSVSNDDLPEIELKMKELARQKSRFIRIDMIKKDAIRYFKEKGDEYKLELLEDLKDGEITFYQQGNFVDLCKGPHLPDTGKIKAIKLLNVAGAYWRGDESRKMMTRIYGITFPSQKELVAHLELLEEAKKRDHRKLGAELELFMFSDKVGAGLPIWLPKGTALRAQLEDFLKKEQLSRGYLPVITPHIGKKDLYVTSGHYDKYGEDSFQPIQTPRENEEFFLKAMNCPHHCEVFANKPRSYRDLPVRIAEFGTVYRYEQSGELHGLTRVRSFTVDDAHIFCTPEQIKDEFMGVLDLVMMVLKKLEFYDFTVQISLRDPENKGKYIGSDENWERAEKTIIEAVADSGLEATTELGEAAFYGPKLDFMIRDALGRSWQMGTIQVDYNLPERFELEYIGPDNKAHRPVMIHRAPFGSMERFIGVLIEHTSGKFPLWLAPEQYAVLPVSEQFTGYALEVHTELRNSGFRGFVDSRNETIGKKIRETEMKKIPFMLIVGEREVSKGLISVRKQGQGDQGSMTLKSFANLLETGQH